MGSATFYRRILSRLVPKVAQTIFGVARFKFLDRLQHYLTHILPLVRVDGTDCTWCTLRLILGGALPKYSAFQCDCHVYLLMDLAPGGQLHSPYSFADVLSVHHQVTSLIT